MSEAHNINQLMQQVEVLEKQNMLLRETILQTQREKEILEARMAEPYSIKIRRALKKILRKKKVLETTQLGMSGENLTVIIKVDQGDNLCEFLQQFNRCSCGFRGQIIIGYDERYKSDILNIDKIKNTVLADNCRFVKSKKESTIYNFLNTICELVQTEWFMVVDETMWFCRNPLERMNEAIYKTGCFFLNLPVLENGRYRVLGSGLYLKRDFDENGKSVIFLPQEEFYIKEVDQFSGKISAKAALFKLKAFKDLGGYDADYDVEADLEFSLRVLAQNLAIGNVKEPFLLYPGYKQAKKSYSCNELEKIQVKYNTKIILNALTKRQDYTGYNLEKLRVAVIADEEEWAYHNIAKQLKQKLENDIEIDIYFSTYTKNIIELILTLQGYDVIHFLWRGVLMCMTEENIQFELLKYRMNMVDFKTYMEKTVITTAVYDHLYLDEKHKNTTDIILKASDYYSVSSQKLMKIYKEKFTSPKAVITDGVDMDAFYPINIQRLDDIKNREVVIGWVGNSRFLGSSFKEDIKGVHSIIKPALENLRMEGANLKLFFADRQEQMIPHHEMVKYYSKIDLLLCASIEEGTPNPILEAMACGVPVISTNVGIVPEVLGEYQHKFIMEEHTIKCLKDKIQLFLREPEMFRKCSEENLKQICAWDWKNKTKEYAEFFNEVYTEKMSAVYPI